MISSTLVMAILPEALGEIRAQIQAGIAPPLERIRGASPLQRLGQGIAILPIKGVINSNDSFLSRFFGGTSHEVIQEMVREVAADDEIESVILEVASPGGVVNQTNETAILIRNLGETKTVVCVVTGDMASGALWIGTAADEVVVSPSSSLGSLGIVALHVDQSRAEAEQGLNFTEVTSGRFKRIVSEHMPLSEDGREYLQSLVDRHVVVFKEAVQIQRELTDSELAAVGEGQLFIGEEAIAVGLADRLGNLDDVLVDFGLTGVQPENNSIVEDVVSDDINLLNRGENTMRIQKLTDAEAREQFAHLFSADITATQQQCETAHTAELSQIEATHKTALQEAVSAKDTAVTAERERIKAIFKIAPQGMGAEVTKAAFEDCLESGAAAEHFLSVANKTGKTLLAEHTADAPAVIEPDGEGESTEASREQDAVFALVETAAKDVQGRTDARSQNQRAAASAGQQF